MEGLKIHLKYTAILYLIIYLMGLWVTWEFDWIVEPFLSWFEDAESRGLFLIIYLLSNFVTLYVSMSVRHITKKDKLK